MWSLFMDSSVSNFHAALLKDGIVVGIVARKAERNMAEFAVSELTGLMAKHKVAFAQLNRIYVTTGPGSFTSLRIALVIAKTVIAKHRHIALWQASSLAFQLGGRSGLSLIDARSDSWYVAISTGGVLTQYKETVGSEAVEELRKSHPQLPVWTDLSEPGLLDDLPARLACFTESADYKTVVATYVKPAFGK